MDPRLAAGIRIMPRQLERMGQRTNRDDQNIESLLPPLESLFHDLI